MIYNEFTLIYTWFTFCKADMIYLRDHNQYFN